MGCSFAMEYTAVAEQRKEPRYGVFLKVIAKEISQFPGCVEDISRSGCKIKFSDVEDFDFESEYNVTVYSQANMEASSFELTLKPNWAARSGTGAVIGFSVLCTPGYRNFIRFVERIAEIEESEEAFAD